MNGVRLVLCAGCTVGLVAAGGCGKGDRWWQKNNEPIADSESGAAEVDTSLSALSQDDDPIARVGGSGIGDPAEFGSTRDQVVESARMMEEYFSGMEAGEDLPESVVIDDSRGQSIGVDESEPVEAAESSHALASDEGSFSLSAAAAERNGMDEVAAVDAEAAGEAVAVVDAAVDEAEEVDPGKRKEMLVTELVEELTRIARTSDNPGDAAAAIAGINSVPIETLEGLRDEGVLSDSELTTLRAAREVLDSISSSGEIASFDDVSDALVRVKEDLDRASGIRVTRALLCTRVDGFGSYEPFASNEFVAGQAQEVIVYVEVDRFGHRALTGNDGLPRFEVEMSQRLELYHVADDLNTWNRAAEVDRSVSRNKVRDYYLINKITLPKNLGVGRYHLKVVMRDLVDERVSEKIIPIRMVVR
tara:strand:+ start:141007 stop:142260 length:1254 start_codon:yes stop_codon:yes gene_type:complete